MIFRFMLLSLLSLPLCRLRPLLLMPRPPVGQLTLRRMPCHATLADVTPLITLTLMLALDVFRCRHMLMPALRYASSPLRLMPALY